MLKFFKRKRLVDQGLACKKTRRSRNTTSDFLRTLESNWIIQILVVAAFLAGLACLMFTGDVPEPLKRFLISVLITGAAVFHFWVSEPSILRRNSRLLLSLGIQLTQLGLINIVLVETQKGVLSPALSPLLIPYTFAPLFLSILLGRNAGLHAAIYTSLWGMFLTATFNPALLVISLLTGAIAVYATSQVRRRSRLIRAGLYIGLATWLLAFVFGEIGPIRFDSLADTDWRMIGWQSLAAVGVGIGTAVVVSGLLPVLEQLFHITTAVSWLEMGDLNHPLLKRMSIEAPGTYHHSLAVANLSEAAAERVAGANPSICHVCSYFHDIGKLIKPDYFTENMRPEFNPHDELTPTMSALIIIAHVKEGVDLALKHKLNQRIVDVIRQHHGNSLVSYFHQRALQQQEDARLGGKIMNMRAEDIPEVNESSFRYPGPRVQTKEAAIISLADAVESASRGMERPTPQKIEDMIHTIVEGRIAEGQLNECPLTLKEIWQVADSFQRTLLSMLHSRIAYPKSEERESASGNRHASKSAA
ncbi:MAG: HDIG domain-containing metalloprotein [Chthoniobacterales bacterium]